MLGLHVGDVDAADGLCHNGATAAEEGGTVEQLIDRLDVQRILADQQTAQTGDENVAHGGVQHGSGDPGRGLHLADADDAHIGGDLDDQRVLYAAGNGQDLLFRQAQLNGFNVCNDHVISSMWVRDYSQRSFSSA